MKIKALSRAHAHCKLLVNVSLCYMLFNFQVVVLVFLKLPCGDTLNIYLLQVLVFNPIILLKKKKQLPDQHAYPIPICMHLQRQYCIDLSTSFPLNQSISNT